MFEPFGKIREKKWRFQSMLFPYYTANNGQISALVNLDSGETWRGISSLEHLEYR